MTALAAFTDVATLRLDVVTLSPDVATDVATLKFYVLLTSIDVATLLLLVLRH